VTRSRREWRRRLDAVRTIAIAALTLGGLGFFLIKVKLAVTAGWVLLIAALALLIVVPGLLICLPRALARALAAQRKLLEHISTCRRG
jgi:hypothetical protein